MPALETYLLIPAGGKGLRLGGGEPKQFRDFGGRPLLLATLEAFFTPGMPILSGIALALPQDRLGVVSDWKLPCPCWVAPGGSSRQESVAAALALLPGRPEAVVMIHDAVRPFPPAAPIQNGIQALSQWDGAILGQPSTDTLKRVDAEGRIVETVPRETIFRAQTPQIAKLSTWKKAFDLARLTGFHATDDAALLEHAGFRVKLIPSPPSNLKITTPEDWATACGRPTHTSPDSFNI